MGTGMEIDRGLLAEAMKAGGFDSERAAVEEGPRLLARTRSGESVRALRGKLRWEGSLDETRRDKQPRARAGRARPRRSLDPGS